MKAKTMVAVTTLLMSSGLVLATGQSQEQQIHHPDSAGGTTQVAPAMPGGSMPMMPMHEQMQKMRSQMAAIHRTEDPDKRDELIESHMEDMQGMMKMMHGMREGQPMMGQGGIMGQGMGMPGGKMMGGQQGDEMAAPQGGMMGGQQGCMMGMRTMKMMNRQQMMEKRMDMMQMMMDQMMQNQAAAEETRKMRDDDKSTGR
jgi:hypothetical protein